MTQPLRFLAMDARPPDLPQRARALEDTLAALDAQLADAEKQAATLLRAVSRFRRAAKEGAIASLPAAIASRQGGCRTDQRAIGQSRRGARL